MVMTTSYRVKVTWIVTLGDFRRHGVGLLEAAEVVPQSGTAVEQGSGRS